MTWHVLHVVLQTGGEEGAEKALLNAQNVFVIAVHDSLSDSISGPHKQKCNINMDSKNLKILLFSKNSVLFSSRINPICITEITGSLYCTEIGHHVCYG